MENIGLQKWELLHVFFANTMTLVSYLWQIVLVVASLEFINAHSIKFRLPQQVRKREGKVIDSHSCIHDQIIEQRRRPGRQAYSVTPQLYEESSITQPLPSKGRALLGISESVEEAKDGKQPIRIYLNYDAVGHSPDRDCRDVGNIVKVRLLIWCCLCINCFLFLVLLICLCIASWRLVISWESLQRQLFWEHLLAIPILILLFWVTAGITVHWMIYLERTKSTVSIRLVVVLLSLVSCRFLRDPLWLWKYQMLDSLWRMCGLEVHLLPVLAFYLQWNVCNKQMYFSFVEWWWT